MSTPELGSGGVARIFFLFSDLKLNFNILKNVMIRILSGDACMMHG